MPVDRRRRDEVAAILVEALRGRIPFTDFIKGANVVLSQSPRLSRWARAREGSGFPLFPISAGEPLNDLVLDRQVGHAIHRSASLLSSRDAKHRDTGREILVRTLLLLRSGLDEDDLALPRNAVIGKYPEIKLGCVSTATLLTSLLALAFLESPYPLLLWPTVGVLLLFKGGFLVRRLPICDDPRSFPFCTVTQWDAARSLISPEESAAFPKANPRFKPEPGQRWTFWRYLLFSPMIVFAVILTPLGLVAFAVLYLLIWPFFLYDLVRVARREQSR